MQTSATTPTNPTRMYQFIFNVKSSTTIKHTRSYTTRFLTTQHTSQFHPHNTDSDWTYSSSTCRSSHDQDAVHREAVSRKEIAWRHGDISGTAPCPCAAAAGSFRSLCARSYLFFPSLSSTTDVTDINNYYLRVCIKLDIMITRVNLIVNLISYVNVTTILLIDMNNLIIIPSFLLVSLLRETILMFWWRMWSCESVSTIHIYIRIFECM